MWLKKIIFVFLVIFTLTISIFVLAKDAYNLPKNPLEGRKLFVKKGCVNCHTLWNIGNAVGPDLVKISKGKSIYQIVGAFWNHSPQMFASINKSGIKSFNFTPKEMEELFSFIYYLNYYDEPGNIKKGEKIFTEKYCIKCHKIGNVGGKIGPSLDEFSGIMSPILIAQRMWNHAPKMKQRMKSMKIKIPMFSGNEIADLLYFIRSKAKKRENIKMYAFAGNPLKGQKIFQEKCDKCHSINGKGSKKAPDLGKKRITKNASELTGIMWNHGDMMLKTALKNNIPYPYLYENEMSDIISYIYFIAFYDTAGDIKKGKEIFTTKKCSKCHSLGNEKEKIAPNLTKSKAVNSPFHLAASLWNHIEGMEKLMKNFGYIWPKFEKNEMRDLVEYLKSTKL